MNNDIVKRVAEAIYKNSFLMDTEAPDLGYAKCIAIPQNKERLEAMSQAAINQLMKELEPVREALELAYQEVPLELETKQGFYSYYYPNPTKEELKQALELFGKLEEKA